MIKANMIVEMAGTPAAYVKEMLQEHLKRIKNYKELQVTKEEYSETKELEQKKDMHTCYAEIEFEATNIGQLTEVIFDFMPSSIEILEPANINLDIFNMTELLNNISGRLHKYDEIAKLAHLRLQHAAKIIKKAEEQGFTLEEQPNEKKEKKPSTKKQKKNS